MRARLIFTVVTCLSASMKIDDISVSAYTVPTDAPESAKVAVRELFPSNANWCSASHRFQIEGDFRADSVGFNFSCRAIHTSSLTCSDDLMQQTFRPLVDRPN